MSRVGFAGVLTAAWMLTAVAAAAGPAVRAQPPGIGSPCGGALALENGSFEAPDVAHFGLVDQGKVPGWSTTATDGRVEVWQTGYLDVPAAEGAQFVELNANMPSALWQDVPSVPGSTLTWRLFHRGRAGTDVMEVRIGPPDGAPTATQRIASGKDAWHEVLGRYVVPVGQERTRLELAAISSASSNPSFGNFVDGAAFGTARCSVLLEEVIAPPSDPARFDLQVDDLLVLDDAGNGARSAPVEIPVQSVRVRAVPQPGTLSGAYATSVRCTDADTGGLLAAAPGSSLTLRFDRARDATCRFASVAAPSVVVALDVDPRRDAGRFDLLVDGAVVATAAGDGDVAAPVRAGPGMVTVGLRAADGVVESNYRFAISCRAAGGLGSLVADGPGTELSFAMPAAAVVGCRLLAVAQPRPRPPVPPAPPSPPPPPVPPAPASNDEADVAVTVTPEAPTVVAGDRLRFTIRVRNRGPQPATDVRVVPVVLGAARPPGGLVTRNAPGPLLLVPGRSAWAVSRLGVGATATLVLDVAATHAGTRVGVRATAGADEPDRSPANNTATAVGRVVAPAPPVLPGVTG